jgi:hypothetical protein
MPAGGQQRTSCEQNLQGMAHAAELQIAARGRATALHSLHNIMIPPEALHAANGITNAWQQWYGQHGKAGFLTSCVVRN